jgi:predicted TIM-barrel fold metal-dependent hydrolase
MATTAPHLPIRPEWLALGAEPALDPTLEIIDPHHHLWERNGAPYHTAQIAADIAESGHRVVRTVFIECKARYRQGGDPLEASLGETEFAAAQHIPGIADGIIGNIDFRCGERAESLLRQHIAAGQGRFRGIRQSAVWHPDPAARGSSNQALPGLFLDPDFRRGFAALAPLGLVFEAWCYFTQFADLRDLAAAFPETTIVLNHVGAPLNIGPYHARQGYVLAEWRAGIRELARYPNLHVKLGGFGMALFNCGCYGQERPPSSAQLAEAWRPYIEYCIEQLGAARCLFESNFPVDKGACSYGNLWNAYKRVAAGASAAERAALFSGTARRVYRLA